MRKIASTGDTADMGLRFQAGGELLSSLITARGPVYRPVPGTAAPRLVQVPSRQGDYLEVPWELHAYQRAPGMVLRPRVSVWLQGGDFDDVAQRVIQPELDRDDKTQLRRLGAAAFHDIGGWSEEAVQSQIGTPGSMHQTRVIRREIRNGRTLWWQLGAWPWWAIRDEVGGEATDSALDGQLARPWWELDRVIDTYRLWVHEP